MIVEKVDIEKQPACDEYINPQMVGYTGMLTPTKEQETLIRKTCGCARKVYNLMLEDRQNQYKEHLASKDNKWRELSTIKEYRNDPELFYLKEVDTYAFYNEKIALQRAFENFFEKRAGYPKFKSKHKDKTSYTTNNTNNSIRFSEDKRYLKLPKLGWVRARMSRIPVGTIKSVTVTIEKTGRFSVSMSVEEYVEELSITNSVTGIDMNLDEVTLSGQNNVKQPRNYRANQKKLAREQRKLSKKAEVAKKEGRRLSDCKNYQKQKKKVAKIHAKIANQRNDFQHKLTRDIVENQDVIVAETLNIKAMMGNHHLAKSFADAAYGEFILKLRYKADWYGRVFIQVPQGYASTQLCSCCGKKCGPKGIEALCVRDWVCPSCGHEHDRDDNACWNTLLCGLNWILLPKELWGYDDGELVETWRAVIDVDHYVLLGLVDFVRAYGCVPHRDDLPYLSDWIGVHFDEVSRTAGMAGLACEPVNGSGQASS